MGSCEGCSHAMFTLICSVSVQFEYRRRTQVYAWGRNMQGQLGVGDRLERRTPVAVEGLWGLPILQLAAGDAHSLAITASGSLFAWGDNHFGQVRCPAISRHHAVGAVHQG